MNNETQTKIKVYDSIKVTQQKRLEKIEKMLPDRLIADHGHYIWNHNYIGIGEPIKVGIINRRWTYDIPFIYVTYTDIRIQDNDYFDLGMQIAKELGISEVVKEYRENEK